MAALRQTTELTKIVETLETFEELNTHGPDMEQVKTYLWWEVMAKQPIPLLTFARWP